MFPAPRKRTETVAQHDARVKRDMLKFRGGPGRDEVEAWIEHERAAGRLVERNISDPVERD